MAASNLTLRLATAGVMLPLLLALLFVGPAWGWLLFLLLVGVVGGVELFGMTHAGDRVATVVGVGLIWWVVLAFWFSPSDPRVLVSTLLVFPFVSVLFTLWRLGDIPTAALRMTTATFGPLWIGCGVGAIALLRVEPSGRGASYVVLSMVLAWIADTGGYFAGRAFGKHKLYQKVSPKKTVEGAAGGMVATIAGAIVVKLILLPGMPYRDAVVLGVLGALLGMFGDLGESLLKRSIGVKDSGGIFPGHGGMLDRVDAVLITAPLTLLYLVWFQGWSPW
jgi:phosphatidate cytidylyltransferase